MILADEPTGNLDSESQREIMALLESLNAQGITVIMVTHEEEVAHHARRILSPARRHDSVGRVEGSVREETQRLAAAPSLAADTRLTFTEIREHLRQGLKTLAANKVRTGLSMLGILIGVAAVVAMLALGQGAKRDIEARLSALGPNLLLLRQGAVRVGGVAVEAGAATRLTIEDVTVIKENAAVGARGLGHRHRARAGELPQSQLEHPDHGHRPCLRADARLAAGCRALLYRG